MKEALDSVDLPEQKEGVQKNIEATVEATGTTEAKQLFEAAKSRLLDVNKWDKICGKLSAVFNLTDEKGNTINEAPSVGNYFKIDIPGPGTVAGKGYDWVRVESIEEQQDKDDVEVILITVRPSDNPSTSNDNVAHFFSDKATSNFLLSRKGCVVTAAVYGRNEMPNTTTSNVIDKTRNAIVGSTASAGFSDPQWQSLVDGVLGKS